MAMSPTTIPIMTLGTASAIGTVTYTTTDWCDPHKRDEIVRKEYEQYVALPVVENYDGPVYMGDTYYSDVYEALDACVDDETHPAYAIAYPCIEHKVAVPDPKDVLYWVDEQWGENFEDYEGDSWTADVKRAAENLVVALQQQAPVVWDADLKHRIILADADPDQEYDVDEDRYDD